MPPKKYKVLRCDHCGALTYKKLTFKTVRCPLCGKPLTGDPMQLCETAKEAVQFIQAAKTKAAADRGGLFETFG